MVSMTVVGASRGPHFRLRSSNNNAHHLRAKRLCMVTQYRPTSACSSHQVTRQALLSLPTLCILCYQSTTSDSLCASCRAALPWNDRACRQCGLSDLPTGRVYCEGCQVQPPLYTRTVAPLHYRGPCARWVVKAKHQSGLVEARLLGRLLADAIAAHYRDTPLPTALIPVPLSWRRLLLRGHNQATLIAEPIQRATRIKLRRRSVQRIRHTSIQPGLSPHERQANLSNAFRVRQPWHGETVAIIDDVMTTGATASALTAALLRAGVAEVHVWCATRASARLIH